MMIMVNGAGGGADGGADGGAQYRVSRAINCFVNIFTICLGCLGPYLTAPRKRVGSVNFTQKLSEFSQRRNGKGERGREYKIKNAAPTLREREV